MNIVRINESFAKNKNICTAGDTNIVISSNEIDVCLKESFSKLTDIKQRYNEALVKYKGIMREHSNYKTIGALELIESYKKAVDDLKLEFEDEKSTFEFYKKIKNKTLTEAEVKLSPEDMYDPASISLSKLAKKASDEEKAEKEKAEKELKYAELKKKNEKVIDDLAHAVADEDEPKDIIEMLFNELVPQSGTSETVAGEIVRAVMRLLYRWFNDGDYFYKGYGLETCGRTVEYLVDDAEVLDRYSVEDWIDSCANRDDDETYYESILDEICEAAISVLDSNHDLFWTPNTEDSRMGKLQWIEDLQPLFDLEVMIPHELQRHIEEGNISEYDLEGELEYWETGYGSIGNNSDDIRVGSDYVEIYGLTEDVYDELEDVLERWLRDYANDLTNQYGDPDEEPEDDDEDDSEEDLDEDYHKDSFGQSNWYENVDDVMHDYEKGWLTKARAMQICDEEGWEFQDDLEEDLMIVKDALMENN